jgi:lysophospholipase L1-like esterase
MCQALDASDFRRWATALAMVSGATLYAAPALAQRIPTHVACVGDSITYGYGASSQTVRTLTIYRSGRWSLLALSLVVLFLVAKPANATVRMPTHVVCVGDSITEGFASSNPATKSYPAQLQALFGSQVMVKNAGHSGTTMLSDGFGDSPYEDTYEYQAATNVVKNAGASAVVDVVILFGANDSKPQNWTPPGKPKNDQQFLTDYRAMVEHFNALTPKPLVFLALPTSTGNNPCCSINGTVIHDEEVPLIKQLAAEQSLPIIDLNAPTAGHPEYFSDGVHPTDAGYLIVAMLVHAGLLQDFTPGAADAGADGPMDGSGAMGDGSADGGAAGNDSAVDAGSGGTGGSAGSGSAGSADSGAAGNGSAVDAGSGGTGGSAAGQSGGSNDDGGQAGSSGGAPAAQGSSSSGGCSVLGAREPGALASVVSLSVLLSLNVRRRRRLGGTCTFSLGPAGCPERAAS